jgi:hypothetical protein
LILLECVQTKLVHYYLPAYPACALLAAWLIDAVTRDEVNLRRWPMGRLSLGLLGGIGIGATAGALAAAIAFSGPTRWPLLLVALLIGGGTLCALERFQKGATRLAALTLVGTWALVMGVGGWWLLPAAEPYRYPRLVAERLTALSSRYRAAPILGAFQEPSIIYCMGRPVPILRSRLDLTQRIRRHGAVLSALLPEEIATLRADGAFTLEFPETLTGFNLSKGRRETLSFALIRLRESAVAGRGEQPLVK